VTFTPDQEARLLEMLEKQAINEVLLRYSRGMDRCDRVMLESSYWPDATDDHVSYVGDAAGFIDYSLATVAQMRTAHRISNVWIEILSPTTARSESYFWAWHFVPSTEGPAEHIVAIARFMDHYEKREGEWRFSRRKLVLDGMFAAPDRPVEAFGELKLEGANRPDDPLYREFEDLGHG
jgi:hypothetical protein